MRERACVREKRGGGREGGRERERCMLCGVRCIVIFVEKTCKGRQAQSIIIADGSADTCTYHDGLLSSFVLLSSIGWVCTYGSTCTWLIVVQGLYNVHVFSGTSEPSSVYKCASSQRWVPPNARERLNTSQQTFRRIRGWEPYTFMFFCNDLLTCTITPVLHLTACTIHWHVYTCTCIMIAFLRRTWTHNTCSCTCCVCIAHCTHVY